MSFSFEQENIKGGKEENKCGVEKKKKEWKN